MRGIRGNSTVDYLMITAVITGIAIPILSRYFGDPFIRAFQSNRGTLVQFIAQNPKGKRPVVPNNWFSVQAQGDQGADQNISVASDLPPPGDINEPTLNDGADVRQQRLKNTRNLKKVGEIKVPGPSAAGGGINGPGNIGVGGGGSGAGIDGKGGLNDDFFNKEGGQQDGGQQAGDSGGGRSTYGKSSGDSEGGISLGGRQNSSGGDNKQGTRKDGEENRKEDSGLSVTKKRDELIAQAQAEERERGSTFDWWVLIKVLIVFLIIFLLVLIALSNLKRR